MRIKLLLLAFLAFFVTSCEESKGPKIYLTKIAQHPALNQTQKGIEDYLSKKGYKIQKTTSADGNIAMSSQIAIQYMSKKPDIIIAIGTPSAQSFLKSDIPVVFSSITDPKKAGLLKNKNMTGVSNFIPIKPQLEFYKELYPKLKKLGSIYKIGEANSVVLNEKIKEVAKEMNIEFIPIGVNNAQEISIAVSKLVKTTDAIFITNDNLALSNFSTIVKIATKSNLPVFVSDTDILKKGAIASYGPKQYDLGLKTGEIVLDILENKKIPPVYYPKSGEKAINLKKAKEINFNISDDILNTND